MKKAKYLVLILLGIILMPFSVEAKEKIDVYFFRGDGCTYCAEAEEFFRSIKSEYGEYYNLKTYETWYDEDNYAVFEGVAAALGDEADGVPYIVIGDQSFNGYSSEYDEQIKQTIIDEYEKEERYTEVTDIINNSDANVSYIDDDVDESSTSSSDIIVLVVSILVIAGLVVMIVVARKKA